MDELAQQGEVRKLHGRCGVNCAGTWNESYSSYHGRSDRRVEIDMKHGQQLLSEVTGTPADRCHSSYGKRAMEKLEVSQ